MTASRSRRRHIAWRGTVAAGTACSSAPCALIEGAYLVRQASPLTDNAQVNRAGTRVRVGCACCRGASWSSSRHGRARRSR